MDILASENEGIQSEMPTTELPRGDQFFQKECLLCDMECVESGISIKGIMIGLGFGLLLWTGIVYAILALI